MRLKRPNEGGRSAGGDRRDAGGGTGVGHGQWPGIWLGLAWENHLSLPRVLQEVGLGAEAGRGLPGHSSVSDVLRASSGSGSVPGAEEPGSKHPRQGQRLPWRSTAGDGTGRADQRRSCAQLPFSRNLSDVGKRGWWLSDPGQWPIRQEETTGPNACDKSALDTWEGQQGSRQGLSTGSPEG